MQHHRVLRIELSSLCLLNKHFTNCAISIVSIVPHSKDQNYSLENAHQNSSVHYFNVSLLPLGQMLRKLSECTMAILMFDVRDEATTIKIGV